MPNPLRAAYEAAKNGGNAPAPTPVAAPTVAAAVAPAVVQTTQLPPTAGGKRDIAALRAKLASGSLGGVNPPEAPAAITEDHAEPRTVETPEGGATPAPGWVETKPGLVVRAPAPEVSTVESEPSTPASPAAELSRGQKAAATRAANKAAKAQPAESAAPPEISETSVAALAASSDLARIADALEQIVFYLQRKDAQAR